MSLEKQNLPSSSVTRQASLQEVSQSQDAISH